MMWGLQIILFQFRMTGTVGDIAPVLDQLAAPLAAVGLSAKAQFDLKLATDELLTNILTHGTTGAGSPDIALTLIVEGQEVRLEIADSGSAFDPRSAPEPDFDATLEHRKLGGLGLFFVKQLIPGLAYRRVDGRNITTLTYPAGG